MGTAKICFASAIVSLLPVAFGIFATVSLRHDGAGAAAGTGLTLIVVLPCLASASFWFFAGMLFVWLQRIRDAADATTAAVEKLRTSLMPEEPADSFNFDQTESEPEPPRLPGINYRRTKLRR